MCSNIVEAAAIVSLLPYLRARNRGLADLYESRVESLIDEYTHGLWIDNKNLVHSPCVRLGVESLPSHLLVEQ